MPRLSKPHLHNGYWRVRIGGKEHHLGKDRRQAHAEFHRLEAVAMRYNPSDRPDTINGAVAAWRALHPNPLYKRWLDRFTKYVGGEYLDAVGADLLTRYAVHLTTLKARRNAYERTTKTWSTIETDTPLSAKTIRHYVRAATTVLRWAHEQTWAPIMPKVPKLPKPVRQARDVDRDQLAEILDGLPDSAGRILRFVAYTGCRPSEACHLEWRHVHVDRGVCILGEHKTADATGESRTIYLTPEAADILRALAPHPGPVFVSRLGKPYTPAGLRSILKRHGGVTPYQLRHSFAQRVADGGEVPIEVLARLLGHASTKTTEHYFQVRDQRAIRAARTLKLHAAKANAG